MKGLRDRAILAVLLGCGLRRSEVAALTFAHILQRDGRWRSDAGTSIVQEVFGSDAKDGCRKRGKGAGKGRHVLSKPRHTVPSEGTALPLVVGEPETIQSSQAVDYF